MINQHVLLHCVPRERAGESAPNLSCGEPALHYVKSALQFALCNSDFAASFDASRAQIIMVKSHALCTDIKRVCEQTHLVAVLYPPNMHIHIIIIIIRTWDRTWGLSFLAHMLTTRNTQ